MIEPAAMFAPVTGTTARVASSRTRQRQRRHGEGIPSPRVMSGIRIAFLSRADPFLHLQPRPLWCVRTWWSRSDDGDNNGQDGLRGRPRLRRPPPCRGVRGAHAHDRLSARPGQGRRAERDARQPDRGHDRPRGDPRGRLRDHRGPDAGDAVQGSRLRARRLGLRDGRRSTSSPARSWSSSPRSTPARARSS